MPPPSRPTDLKIKPIPSYIVPRPHSSLLASITSIPPTWRSDLLSSIPPNLTDWFIPISHPDHWEVYKPPIFTENEGRWRFEYKTAFAHVLDYFDEEFVDFFKIITGIGVGSGWKGMFDIMEVIDCIEHFIERVKDKPLEPSPSLRSSYSQTQEQYRHLIPPEPNFPKHNLRLDFLRSNQVPVTSYRTPIPLPESEIASSPSSGNSRFSRKFGDWLQHQRQNNPGPPTRNSSEEGKTSQEIDPVKLTHALKRCPRLIQSQPEEDEDGRRIRYMRERKRRRIRNPLSQLKTYPRAAFKAVLTSPAKLHRQWRRMECSIAYMDLSHALNTRRRGIIKKCDQASKAIITSPKKIIKKCGNLLHLRKQHEPVEVKVESTCGESGYSSLNSEERVGIKDWEKRTRCIPMTRRRPPPSFEYDYPVTGPGWHSLRRKRPPIVPKPARPDTPIDPTIVKPQPRTRSPPRWCPPPGGPPNEFRDFMKVIGWPV